MTGSNTTPNPAPLTRMRMAKNSKAPHGEALFGCNPISSRDDPESKNDKQDDKECDSFRHQLRLSTHQESA
jgi:hypothetical protein